MAKGSGSTKSSLPTKGATASVVKGSIYDIEGGKAFVDEVKKLANEYSISVDIAITPKTTGAFADSGEEGKNEINLFRALYWQTDGEYPHNVGGNSKDLKVRMKAVAAHEFAHLIAKGLGYTPETAQSWEEYKKNGQKNGLKVAVIKTQYEKYLNYREKKFQQLAPSAKQRSMLSELAKVAKEYEHRKTSERLSEYADTNEREFVSEAFAYGKIHGKGKNSYADRVVSIINKYRH